MAQKKSNKWIWGILIFVIIILIFAFGYGFKTKTYYIGDQTPTDFEEISDALSEEERAYYENRVLFEANYYSNKNENGAPLQELRLNFFTDPSLSSIAVRGSGMQYKGHYKSSIRYVSWGSETATKAPDLYYYDTTVYNGDVISWDGDNVATNLVRGKSLIVKIDNKPYLIKLTAKKDKKFLGFTYETIYYGYDDLFEDVMLAIQSNSKSYGDYYITLDLSFYFTVFAYDELSGKWNDDNIAKEVLTYSVLKFHYDENGAQTTNDSIFGVIENDSEFDIRPYTINSYLNDGTDAVSTKEYAYDEVVYFGKATRAGYDFIGWNTQPDGSGTAYNFGDKVNAGAGQVLNFYAQWIQKTIKVRFEDTASGQDICQEFFAGQTQNLQLNTFVRDGFKFVGWNTQRDGSGTAYIDGQALLFEEYRNVFYLYAQWELITAEPVAVAVGDNLRGKTLEIEIYAHSGDGWTLFSFKDRSQGYIKTLDADLDIEDLCGYEGFGLFADVYRYGDGIEIITIQIPDDADYIVSYINYDYGVNYALYY